MLVRSTNLPESDIWLIRAALKQLAEQSANDGRYDLAYKYEDLDMRIENAKTLAVVPWS